MSRASVNLPRYDGGRRYRLALLALLDARAVTRRERRFARLMLLATIACVIAGHLIGVTP